MSARHLVPVVLFAATVAFAACSAIDPVPPDPHESSDPPAGSSELVRGDASDGADAAVKP